MSQNSNLRYVIPDIYTEIPITRGLDVQITDNITVSVPLAEGPYRPPFPDIKNFVVRRWKDLNLNTCNGKFPDFDCKSNLDWLGGKATYDGHDGTDVEVPVNQEIYAMRSGRVFDLRAVDPNNLNDGYEILIKDDHPFSDRGNSFHSFVHVLNTKVTNGQHIDPTTLIGTGSSKLNGGKVHISFYYGVPDGRDPRSIDFHINPWNHCPFGEHLWTSIQGLAPRVVEYYEMYGGIRRVITPEVYNSIYILDNVK